jgi:hypothetical protein
VPGELLGGCKCAGHTLQNGRTPEAHILFPMLRKAMGPRCSSHTPVRKIPFPWPSCQCASMPLKSTSSNPVMISIHLEIFAVRLHQSSRRYVVFKFNPQPRTPSHFSLPSQLMHPRSLRHPLPINKHTPALSTPPSLAPNTRLLPRVQHIPENLIIETARLQPNAFNP